MKTTTELKRELDGLKLRSAWNRGVRTYAYELIDSLDENHCGETIPARLLQKKLLCGADSWQSYSAGGCSLIFDGDIAERLCSPSELKRTAGGIKDPNSRESWIDVQGRALHQAAEMLRGLSGGESVYCACDNDWSMPSAADFARAMNK